MRTGWRTTALVLGALLLVTAVWGGLQWSERARAETLQTAQYQRAFYELLSQVEQTQVLLAKSLVAASDGQRVIHLTDVWRQAFGAQANLNQLPLGTDAVVRTSQLLTQAGDYAYVLARHAARGDGISDEHWETLAELQHQIGLIAVQLHEVLAEAGRGSMSWDEMRRMTRRRLEDAPNNFRDGFDSIEKQLVEFPTLIYDGPFSDHLEQQEPKGLTGSPVDEAEAVRIAREFLPDGLDKGNIEGRGRVEGRIPAFRVRATTENGVVDLDVAEQSGQVLWLLAQRRVEATTVAVDDAIERARQFLAERGLHDMTPTWVSTTQNRAIIPFARTEDDIVVYPDLVKVTVALDDGEIIGYEAMGYIMSHHARDLPAPMLTEAEAREKIHPNLSVNGGRLALIPLETLAEVLTWEFFAEIDDDPYVVYINALTGEEERILKLLDTDEGMLVL